MSTHNICFHGEEIFTRYPLVSGTMRHVTMVVINFRWYKVKRYETKTPDTLVTFYLTFVNTAFFLISE